MHLAMISTGPGWRHTSTYDSVIMAARNLSAVTRNRTSQWHGPILSLEDAAVFNQQDPNAVENPEEDKTSLGDDEVDTLDAASHLSLAIGDPQTPSWSGMGGLSTRNLLPPRSQEILDDDTLERVAKAYEEGMGDHLQHQPSMEEIINILNVLEPTAESLRRLSADDFLHWTGQPLGVALQVAAVSGPLVWVPLHLEMRQRCGYVR